jgi:hypothetical protein
MIIWQNIEKCEGGELAAAERGYAYSKRYLHSVEHGLTFKWHETDKTKTKNKNVPGKNNPG